jgi:hypothetical protein
MNQEELFLESHQLLVQLTRLLAFPVQKASADAMRALENNPTKLGTIIHLNLAEEVKELYPISPEARSALIIAFAKSHIHLIGE